MSASPTSRASVRRRWTSAALLLALVFLCGSARAQQLTPRSYAPNPTGGNILLLSYARSTGGVLFDPALPFDDVDGVTMTADGRRIVCVVPEKRSDIWLVEGFDPTRD